MRFKAHYIQQAVSEGRRLDYWRTVDADGLPEAETIAKRYIRKGYMLGAVIQDLNYAA